MEAEPSSRRQAHLGSISIELTRFRTRGAQIAAACELLVRCSDFKLQSNFPMLDVLPIGTKGENWYRPDAVPFPISPETRSKHVSIVGATGAGKSTLLRNMIAWDLDSGAGVSVVDPHGQLAEDVLSNHIPRSRINDVVVFDPKDRDHPIGLNVLDCPRKELRGLVVSHVVSIFYKLWAATWGPRLEHILRNALYVLIE